MKYSILGTNGFLSTAIAKYCNFKGYKLDVYGLEKPQDHNFNDFFEINFMKEDLIIENILSSDVIVYAIGAGIQSNLKEGNNLIYTLNVTVPVNICNKLKANNFKGVFITFGSVFEMGETSLKRPFIEEEILFSNSKAPNDYTVSKRMLSRFVSSYQHDFTHLHFYIPTIYGEGENPMRLIPYCVNAIKQNSPMQFTSGDQVRQYIYVNEVPEIIDECILKGVPSGLYNLEGNETLTVKEIVTIIHKSLGKKVPDTCFGKSQRNDVGMKYLALNGNKLKSFINITLNSKIEQNCLKY